MCFVLTGCGESTDVGTVWFSGAEFSVATTAKDGDFFLDTDDGKVYRYVSGSWIYLMCIKGEDGEDGSNGSDGTNAYIHIVYSAYEDGMDGGASSFSSAWSSGLNYLGVYSGSSETAPTEASAYTWILICYESTSETPTTTTYTITYELDGGTNSASNPSSYTSESGTITLASPTKEGYTFSGWYSDASFTTKVTTITSTTGNITLYAKWTETTSGTVYEDITSSFSWAEKGAFIVAEANGNRGRIQGSSTYFTYSSFVDVSSYVGCYLVITVPVYTATNGSAPDFGLAFTSDNSATSSTKSTIVSYYQIRSLSDAGVSSNTTETVTLQIPDGAVYVITTFWQETYAASYGTFSAVITSEA